MKGKKRYNGKKKVGEGKIKIGKGKEKGRINGDVIVD